MPYLSLLIWDKKRKTGGKLVTPSCEPPPFKPTPALEQTSSNIQRPRGPPPPTPSLMAGLRLSNGRSTESILSIVSDVESVKTLHNSSPPPKKVQPLSILSKPVPGGLRRSQALYDCEADNEDELSFREGEVIIVTNEQTDDENWKYGYVEKDPARHGMFPVSFVHMLSD
uniref:(California timema) hypothetical protein n=1 Tax=Timema californicum TaxID=61474 RepID=A0A7R9IY67_TIMCA|nr:unnamed protein product [Timema californicum]